jgi:hypothetical protein
VHHLARAEGRLKTPASACSVRSGAVPSRRCNSVVVPVGVAPIPATPTVAVPQSVTFQKGVVGRARCANRLHRAPFDEVAELLGAFDAATTRQGATHYEQRVLVHELLKELAMVPDHLEVSRAGVPRRNATLEEVGMQFCGVREGT